ncbi:MAG: tetratricopeptide repeat protein [Planctomycetaceae bacterium]
MENDTRHHFRSWKRVGSLFVLAVIVCFSGSYALRWHGIRQARQALTIHDPDLALQWLATARRFSFDNAEIQFLTARAYRRLGDPEAMRQHLELAGKLGWPRDVLEREFTLAQAQAGMLQQAEPYLQGMLLDSGGDGAEICAAFVNGYVHHYQFGRAFALLDAWEKDFPVDAEPYMMRGRLRYQWQDWTAAEAAFRAALDRRPELFEAKLGLAHVLAAQQKLDVAERLYLECLKSRPHDTGLLIGWGECLANQGRPEEAADVFHQAIANEPDNCSARLGLGKISLDNGDADEAITWLEPALAACPRQPDVRYIYAQALLASGRKDAAAEHLEFFKSASDALREVSRLTLHLVTNPDDLKARFEVGRLYLEFGTAEEGANWLKTVLAVDPNHVPAHRLLMEYYQQHGEDDLAEQHRAFLKTSGVPGAS